MKKSVVFTALSTVLILLATNLFAQTEDAEGCQDPRFLNRLPKYYIQECSENYNEYEFVTGEEKTQTIEGTVTEIIYTYDGPYGPSLPSKLQVIRNYENAITSQGGKKIYSRTKDDGDWTGATFSMQKDGKEYWIGIYKMINNPVDQFSFVMLAREAMKQEISANEMFDKINSGNSLTLYINFETGKSTIQNESKGIVDELHKMLTANPSLKIIIEGHTDNVGNKSANQTLSEQRASSVKQALLGKGVAGERIQSAGYGQEKPIADNSTEDGKARNRRVEIKKQ